MYVRCRDLVKLRLRAAEAYVKVLTGKQNACLGPDRAKNNHMALTAAVSGLGPTFQIAVKVLCCAIALI